MLGKTVAVKLFLFVVYNEVRGEDLLKYMFTLVDNLFKYAFTLD